MAFRDKYTDFTFDDKLSSSYKVWITNKNDLQVALTPNFSDKFTSPQFGGVRYLDGTTIDKTDIQVNCIAIDITLNEWRAICNWLSPTKIGRLSFDFNNKTYYTVKLSKSVNGKMFNAGFRDSVVGDRKIIEFTLNFTTVGDYAAIGPLNFGTNIPIDGFPDVTDLYTQNLFYSSNNSYYFPLIMEDPSEPSPGYVSGLTIPYSTTKAGTVVALYDSLDDDDENKSAYISYDKNTKMFSVGYRIDPNNPRQFITSTYKDTIYTIDLFPLYSKTAIENLPCLNIYNTGEYDMYSDIYLSNVKDYFELWFDNRLYYRYTFAPGITLNNIHIDTKTGLVYLGKSLLDNAVDAYGFRLINGVTNNGPLTIPSGSPEIHPVRYLNMEGTYYYFQFLDDGLISSVGDSTNIAAHFFTKVSTNDHNHYGVGSYGDSEYFSRTGFENDWFAMHIECLPHDSIENAIRIQGHPNGTLPNPNSKGYLAFCHGHSFIFRSGNNEDKDGKMVCNIFAQTRGAI